MLSSKLILPQAGDSEAILRYLKQIKEICVSPETQKNNILNLLRDEKFDYEQGIYNRIVKELYN